MSRSQQRAYPKTANTKNSEESDALMNNADTDHDKIQSPQDNDIEASGRIQSPQDEDTETNYYSLNPTVANNAC